MLGGEWVDELKDKLLKAYSTISEDGKKIAWICRRSPITRVCGSDDCPTICTYYELGRKAKCNIT